ncbi:hypothetical protein CIAM_44160 (plasmid) [Citrobacter amalonaticus]|nr:hypothetical protein CIAM_44160 [Citrobacter amalonaticus]
MTCTQSPRIKRDIALSFLICGTLLRRAATKTRRKAEDTGAMPQAAAQALYGLNAP